MGESDGGVAVQQLYRRGVRTADAGEDWETLRCRRSSACRLMAGHRGSCCGEWRPIAILVRDMRESSRDDDPEVDGYGDVCVAWRGWPGVFTWEKLDAYVHGTSHSQRLVADWKAAGAPVVDTDPPSSDDDEPEPDD